MVVAREENLIQVCHSAMEHTEKGHHRRPRAIHHHDLEPKRYMLSTACKDPLPWGKQLPGPFYAVGRDRNKAASLCHTAESIWVRDDVLALLRLLLVLLAMYVVSHTAVSRNPECALTLPVGKRSRDHWRG